MNYRDPALRENLAAGYALGTLRGRARRRFERLMEHDRSLRDLAADWESRLNPLAETLRPVPPPPDLWQRIEATLGPEAGRARPARGSWLDRLFARPAMPIPTLASAGLWYCVGFWRTLGLTAVAASIALALYIAAAPPAAVEPSHVALLAGEDQRPVLFARLDRESGRLELRPVDLPPAQADEALELWLIPADGAPRSLGLIGPDGLARDLAQADTDSLAAGALAVSREPAGGSPTGQPTGPVLYSGAVVPVS